MYCLPAAILWLLVITRWASKDDGRRLFTPEVIPITGRRRSAYSSQTLWRGFQPGGLMLKRSAATDVGQYFAGANQFFDWRRQPRGQLGVDVGHLFEEEADRACEGSMEFGQLERDDQRAGKKIGHL